MKLYDIMYDAQHYYVEACNYATAVDLWTRHVEQLWGTDYDGTEQPESVRLVHDGDVIREGVRPIQNMRAAVTGADELSYAQATADADHDAAHNSPRRKCRILARPIP